MPDYRSYFDAKWVKAWDLGGKPCTVTIVKVEAGVLENPKARKKDRAPILWFKGAQKPLALNRTNSKTIATLYGNDTDGWVGRSITIYPTRTQFGNEEVDCIRVKPEVPKGKAQNMPAPPAMPVADSASPNGVGASNEAAPEPGSDG